MDGWGYFWSKIIGQGLAELWFRTPKLLKYAFLIVGAAVAAYHGWFRSAVFLSLFIPAMAVAQRSDAHRNLVSVTLPVMWSFLLMTSEAWDVGIFMLIGSIAFIVFLYWSKNSIWPFGFMCLAFSPLAYFMGSSGWAIAHLIIGSLLLFCVWLWRYLYEKMENP